MTLKSRLSQLQTQAGSTDGRGKDVPVTPSAAASLKHRLAQIQSERVLGRSDQTQCRCAPEVLARTLNGELLTDGLIAITEHLRLRDQTGCHQTNRDHKPLDTSPRLPGEQVPPFNLYIDTETTGLAGGSGTLAFLIGVAWLEGSGIVLKQFLITAFSSEKALLQTIMAEIPKSCRWVSYNGKSYDLPLLVTRFRMQGLPTKVLERMHLDLLHPVRRLFNRQWEDCRLQTVEKKLLGFTRSDDLPGAMAPEAWFDYVRRGNPDRLVRVVEHNRQDILSLIRTHHLIADIVTDPTRFHADIYGLAKWLMKTNLSQSIKLLQTHQGQLCDDGLRLLANLLRRTSNWSAAVPIWKTLANRGCCDSTERLAKYHEHIDHDLELALHYARRLPGQLTHQHRCQRLIQKQTKSRPAEDALPGLL